MKAKLLKKFRRSAKRAIYYVGLQYTDEFTGEVTTWYNVTTSHDHQDILRVTVCDPVWRCHKSSLGKERATEEVKQLRRDYINGLVRLIRSGKYTLDHVLKFL